jgi:succinoglycan biosynthesis transport protein ExoP
MFDPKQFTPAANGPPGGANPPLPHAPVQSAHVFDRLSILFKHRRLALTVFFVTAGVMMAQTYATIPLYRAKSQILIQDERSTAISNLTAADPTFWQDPEPYYNTQYRILQSRGLARRVVKRLDLQNVPEFNGTMAAPGGPLALVRAARAKVTGGFRRAYATITKRGAEQPAETPAADETEQEAALVGAFLSRVRIEPERGTRLVDAYFDAADPAFAARAADALAEEYVQQNLELKLGNIRKSLVWLDEELKRQQQKITQSESALTEYRSRQNAPSLDNRQNIVVARLNQLNDAVTSARTSRVQKESLFRQVEKLDPKSANVDSFPAVAQSAAVLETRNRLSTLEQQKASLTGRYGPQHPEMQKLETQIENARRQIRVEAAKAIEQLRSEYLAAVAQERSLGSSLDEQKQAALDLDRKSAAYSVLERQAESDRKVYESLLQQQKELSVIGNSKANNVQVMDRAEVPGAPFTPNTRRDWMMALLLGVGLAVGLAFGVEFLDDTVKTPDDVTRRLKLPMLGLIPAAQEKEVPLLTGSVSHNFGEAFRSLRTSLVFTSGGESARIVGVTSSQPLEGKTTTACNLAAALALGGARVLLIDADMRRPSLHKTMGLQNGIGLSHLLVGQSRVRDAVQRTSEPNLFVITAGRTPPNPSELLSSDRMKAFLQNLAAGPFDWVVLDTPPVLAVTDAVILAPSVTGLVFVIGSEMTRRIHAERALETLRTSRPNILGVVLNRVDFEGNRYYYSRYYGYQYKNYYGQAAAT